MLEGNTIRASFTLFPSLMGSLISASGQSILYRIWACRNVQFTLIISHKLTDDQNFVGGEYVPGPPILRTLSRPSLSLLRMRSAFPT